MPGHHHHHHDHHGHDHGLPPPGAGIPAGYARVLRIALAVNAAMFLLEVGAGLTSGSVALLADSIDFFGDAANYGISLALLGSGLAARLRVAQLKAATMLLFGVLVLGRAFWAAATGAAPEPLTMGAVGLLALAANLGVGGLLYRFREGDADMRSVWLCTRNDAIGNLAVLGAAAGVFGSGTRWPDVAVAIVMGTLALVAGASVLRQARSELTHTPSH